MRTRTSAVSSVLVVGLLAIAGVASAEGRREEGRREEGSGVVGHVYTETNGAEANTILVFDRAGDGTLTAAGSMPTGGKGTGAGLGSQGALARSEDGRWLLAVNGGTSTVSLFQRDGQAWALRDVAPSGGTTPVSVTEWGGLVYVLNAGSTQNISGFTIGGDKRLHLIDGSTQPLSSQSAVGAAEVRFAPDGNELVVTEKGTNRIDSFRIERDGRAAPGVFTASTGATPYGFDFTPDGYAIVSDAAGAASGAGAVTSYAISDSGATTAQGAVGDLQTAPCWVAVSPDGEYAWTTNAASGTISTYAIGDHGMLTLVPANGDSASTGATSHPTELSPSPSGRHLFALTPGAGTITSLAVHAGMLETGATVPGIPSYGAGLIAE